MLLLFTTNPGIEDIAAWEAAHKLQARIVDIKNLRGRIIVEVEDEKLYLIEYMKSIHRPKILLYRGETCRSLNCIEKSIREAIYSSQLEEYLSPQSSFAVRAERTGEHEYTSLDIARIAGRTIQDYIEDKYGVKPRVDLDSPNVIISVDVIYGDV